MESAMTEATAASHPPVSGRVAELGQQWIDPVREDRALTLFELYPQPFRDHGKGELEVAFRSISRPSTRPRRNAASPSSTGRRSAISWYVDSKDGTRLLEQSVVSDLVGYVHRACRSIAGPWARTVEGFSLGALHLGFKYPKLFANVPVIAPSILRDLSLQPAERADTFGDNAYYQAVAPWTYCSPTPRRSATTSRSACWPDHRTRASPPPSDSSRRNSRRSMCGTNRARRKARTTTTPKSSTAPATTTSPSGEIDGG